MIKALIFDLDNTLYDEKIYFLEVFRKFAEINHINFELFDNNFNDDLCVNSADIFGDLLKKINIYSPQKQNELFQLYKIIDVKLDLYEDAKDIIEFAKQNNIKIGLITNGVLDAQKNKVKCLNIEHTFDAIIYAREFGKDFEKPHKKPFEKLLRDLEMDFNSILFIGDNPYTDIIGAKLFGLKTVFLKRGYYRNSHHTADFEIDSLRSLKEMIIADGDISLLL